MARSTFSHLGLPIGENNINMTYLYGLSDFFSVMFENSDKVNLLLEAQSEVCSSVYSRFLQMSANISLEDIQKTSGQTLKLIVLNSTDAITGEVNTYKLNTDVVSARYIANRPLLPSALFEENVDFRLEEQTDGTFTIRFASDISNAGFSTRLLSDGTTKEYALWFVDSEIDEKWISTYFGDLIGLSPESSTTTFKNFVYGLYYVYANGPALDLLRKGLNLALGIPLSRGTETVLEIRKYLGTDQYIVVTDANQYFIPYGLAPVVVEGQVLAISDEIARWVEVKDYINDGEWWINLQIPAKVIPSVPPGQKDRYATAGSHFDQLMRNYLKKHTFLVNVKVTSFKDTQLFQQLSEIIKNAKPAYTDPIYIWTVEQTEEIIFGDDLMLTRIDQSRCDQLSAPIGKFYRGNAVDALKRGCPTFSRFNVPMSVTRLCGTDTYTNGNPDTFLGGSLNGYVNPVLQYRENTETERSWIRAINSRNTEIVTGLRSRVGFYRGIHSDDDEDFDHSGVPVSTTAQMSRAVSGVRIIPLYLTTQKDIQDKCNALGLRVPNLTEWTFKFLDPDTISAEINGGGINEGIPDTDSLLLSNNFNLAFYRGTDVQYLGNFIPADGFTSWAPSGVSDLEVNDYILGIRVYDKVVGMYWVTSNFNIETPYYNPIADTDSAVIELENRPTRGLGPMGSSRYLLRGRGALSYNTTGLELNASAINEGGEDATETVTNDFSDSENMTPVTLDRSGAVAITHIMELN